MREGTVEQSTIVYRGVFERMLPSLPTPGTTAFASLTKLFSPHGLSAAGIELEAPTGVLNDVVLTFSLLNDRLKLKLSYGWFEFLVTNLYEGDEPALVEIASQLITALREIDGQLRQGYGRYRCYAHIKLAPQQAEEFLGEHLVGKNKVPQLLPDAFAYEITLDQPSKKQPARVVVAKSSQFENALFLDLSIEYVSPDEPGLMAERINRDYEQALSLLGLKP